MAEFGRVIDSEEEKDNFCGNTSAITVIGSEEENGQFLWKYLCYHSRRRLYRVFESLCDPITRGLTCVKLGSQVTTSTKRCAVLSDLQISFVMQRSRTMAQACMSLFCPILARMVLFQAVDWDLNLGKYRFLYRPP